MADEKQFNAEELKRSIKEKIKAAKANLKGADASMLDVYILADLSDDEIWVMAQMKANASRVNMEWEGFNVTDQKQREFMERRYKSLQSRIKARKEELQDKGSK
jgi:hypothetical protein